MWPPRTAIVPYNGYTDPFGAPYLAPTYGYFYNPYAGPSPYYYYNPYVAPFPAYAILPPPFATMRMVYGDIDRERTDVRRSVRRRGRPRT